MSTSRSPQLLDARLLLDMMQLQLNWLEREMALLRQTIGQSEAATAPRRTFASLRGAWAGVIVSDPDFKAARLTLPESLA